MSTSGQHSRGYAVQVFALLLCAQEPLSPEAMVQALGKARSEPCEITASALFDICSNLVILDSEVNTLRFAHASFPEFLATKEEFASRNVHQIASINCLDTCLEGSPLEEDGTPLPRPDFYHYSAIYWQEHCRLASIDGLASSVVSKMREYVFDEGDISLTFVDWMGYISRFIRRCPTIMHWQSISMRWFARAAAPYSPHAYSD